DEGNRGEVYARAGEHGYTANGRLQTYNAEAISAFAQNTMSWGDWAITPGLRIETFNQYKKTNFHPKEPDKEGISEKDSNTLLLPGLSVVYSGFDNSEIYAGIHRGYAPASARSDEFPLTPETGINSQIGLRSSATKGAGPDMALCYNRTEDTPIRAEV